MMRISLYKREIQRRRLIKKILGDKPTRDSLDRFKKLPGSELRRKLRDSLYEELSTCKPGFLSKSLDFSLETIRMIGSHLRRADKRYRIDTGMSILRGVDHNHEFEFQSRVYHYSAGAANSENGNGDALTSIVSDKRNEIEIHAVFDGSATSGNAILASSKAADILEKATTIGFVEDVSDLLKVIREIHHQLSKKELFSTGTIALIRGNKFSLLWIGDSPAVLLKKTKDGYDASRLTKDTKGLIGHESFGSIGHTDGMLCEGDVLLIQSKSFLDLNDRYALKLLKEIFENRIRSNIELYGFGPSLTHPRIIFGRLEERSIEGPFDDASVLIVRR